MADTRAPTADLVKIFKDVQGRFKSTDFGAERWYLLTLAVIVGGGRPEAAADLYLYLISEPGRETSEARQALVRRLREVLVKSVSTIGVCKPIEAILGINSVERPEDKDHSFSRKEWKSGEENRRRAEDWMTKVYSRNLEAQRAKYNDHLDFGWLSMEITYGLYLSDRQILDDIDTELVVLSSIMIQNLPNETHWHIRGARRVGMSREDVQVVWDSIQHVAQFIGVKLDRVPTPADVESDV